MSEPRDVVADLRMYANHFAHRDWDYTRVHDIKHIRYENDWRDYQHPLARLKRWARDYVRLRPRSWVERTGRELAYRHPIIHAKASLRTESHLPDGVLDNGGIITHWEETGEYLQMLQPSVGSLIADLLDAHRELPEAGAVIAELERISNRYSSRVESGEVTRPRPRTVRRTKRRNRRPVRVDV